MIYPYSLLAREDRVESLLGKVKLGEPMIFDFSGGNPDLWEMDMQDQVGFQKYVEDEMKTAGSSWGIAGYLEKRDSLLRDLPQMVSEQRFFHLGVDVILPKGARLYLPIEGVVEEIGYEEGKGNFGGFVLIKHAVKGGFFYSLWGHLEKASLPEKGRRIEAGEGFASLGDYAENGDWFYHTHLQVLTEKGLAEGFLHKGYCSKEMLAVIDQYCPSPLFMLKF